MKRILHPKPAITPKPIKARDLSKTFSRRRHGKAKA